VDVGNIFIYSVAPTFLRTLHNVGRDIHDLGIPSTGLGFEIDHQFNRCGLDLRQVRRLLPFENARHLEACRAIALKVSDGLEQRALTLQQRE
jgi:hypothetical protein